MHHPSLFLSRLRLMGACVCLLCSLCIAGMAAPSKHTHKASHALFSPSYYKGIEGLSGEALKKALADCVSPHTVLTYRELWYRFEFTDEHPATPHRVHDYYSDRVYYFKGNGTTPDEANKEHVCPKSWWGGRGDVPAFTDLYNVMPSDSRANQAKSHFPVGVVGHKVSYQNECLKVGQAAREMNYHGKVFEPCDEYKGDFARVYFYMATVYAALPWGANPHVASSVGLREEDYPTLQPWILPLLLAWHRQDPVSDFERQRCDRVFREQGNRNPFIDYPELAEHIWGNARTTPFAFANRTAKPHRRPKPASPYRKMPRRPQY